MTDLERVAESISSEAEEVRFTTRVQLSEVEAAYMNGYQKGLDRAMDLIRVVMEKEQRVSNLSLGHKYSKVVSKKRPLTVEDQEAIFNLLEEK